MHELLAAHSSALPSGEPPEWVHLLPLGRFQGRDGRGPYEVADKQAAQKVVDTSLAYQSGADMPIDYDHQLIWSRENGQPAPASGWIKGMEVRPDGIWGRVDWTAQAVARLTGKEYRYISPVFTHTQDGTVLRIACAALSNNPNLELTALASQLLGGDPPVELKDFLKMLAAKLGLPPESTAETVTAHCQKLAAAMIALPGLAKVLGAPDGSSVEQLVAHSQKEMAEIRSTLASVAKALGASENATREQLAAHAANMPKPGEAGAVDPAKFVPTEQVAAMSARLQVLEGERVAGLVDKAIKDFKITPGQRDWAMAYASKDEAGFSQFVANAVAVVKPGESGPAGAPPQGDGLTDVEVAICSQTGIKREDFLKTRNVGKGGK
jgi:phage I-like protein